MDTGKLVYELKRPIKVISRNASEPIEVTELVLNEPNKYNMDEFYDFQSMGLEVFRKALERQKKEGTLPDTDTVSKQEAEETPYKELAEMVRLLVFSSYHDIRPSEFINAFKKVVFCKNKSYVTAMDVDVTQFQFEHVHRDDLAKIACEYFAFFCLSDFVA